VVLLELPGRPDHKAIPDHKALQGLLAHKELREQKAILAHKVFQ
jgi:hypothetical protein